MKIICTKEEFAVLVDSCAMNRLMNDCCGCILNDGSENCEDCFNTLMQITEIQKE